MKRKTVKVIAVVLMMMLVFGANVLVVAGGFMQANYPTSWTFVGGRTVQVEFNDDGSFGFWSGNRIWNQLVAANMIHLPNQFNGGAVTEAAILNGRVPAPNAVTTTANALDSASNLPMIRSDAATIPTVSRLSNELVYDSDFVFAIRSYFNYKARERTAPIRATAETPLIRINNQFIDTGDQPPVVVDGRVLVPFRSLGEALGFSRQHGVSWMPRYYGRYPIPGEGTATFGAGTPRVTVRMGEDSFYVRDRGRFSLDVPAQLINNRVMLPLRAIPEGMGMIVEWNDNLRIADIWTSQMAFERSRSNLSPRITEQDLAVIRASHYRDVAGRPSYPLLPNAEYLRLTEQELQNWIAEYRATAGGATSEFEREVVRLINIERANYGLRPLIMEENIMMAARFKSQGMVDFGYFSHQSPVYGSPGQIARMFGVWAAGENLAGGGNTPQEVVNAWMNSPGHRAIMLSRYVETIGIGRVGRKTTMRVADSVETQRIMMDSVISWGDSQ